jgi:uncharacterized membrane protein
MNYEFFKVLHVLSVCGMVGATLCNGLLHNIVNKQGITSAAVVTLSNIMQINRVVMGPSLALIAITGGYLVSSIGYTLSDTWLQLSIVLTAALIVAFIAGYYMEARLEKIAIEAKTQNDEQLPKSYQNLFFRILPIGFGATLTSILIIYLMITKHL